MSLVNAFVIGVVFTTLLTWITVQKDTSKGPDTFKLRSQPVSPQGERQHRD